MAVNSLWTQHYNCSTPAFTALPVSAFGAGLEGCTSNIAAQCMLLDEFAFRLVMSPEATSYTAWRFDGLCRRDIRLHRGLKPLFLSSMIFGTTGHCEWDLSTASDLHRSQKVRLIINSNPRVCVCIASCSKETLMPKLAFLTSSSAIDDQVFGTTRHIWRLRFVPYIPRIHADRNAAERTLLLNPAHVRPKQGNPKLRPQSLLQHPMSGGIRTATAPDWHLVDTLFSRHHPSSALTALASNIQTLRRPLDGTRGFHQTQRVSVKA